MIRVQLPSIADELDRVDPRTASLHPIVKIDHKLRGSQDPRLVYKRNWMASRRRKAKD